MTMQRPMYEVQPQPFMDGNSRRSAAYSTQLTIACNPRDMDHEAQPQSKARMEVTLQKFHIEGVQSTDTKTEI